MLRASRDMGFGDDWKAALEKVKTLHVEPGKQTDLVRDLAREAVDYVRSRDLVTVPPLADETWRMTMMSPERQKVNPFFLGGEVIQVSYPTDTMDQDDKLMSMRGNNIHFSRSTVFHELIPGHDLQQFMTARYNSHRRAFGTPFWTEGWSLYWEMLLVGRRLPEDAGESRRHALLAHAPLRAHHLLAALPHGHDGAGQPRSTSWSIASATNRPTPRPRSADRSTAPIRRSTSSPT